MKEKKRKQKILKNSCKKCDKILLECEEYKQGWKRALADYDNFQKETDKKKKEWAVMSEIAILEEFIPVYENFKKAFAADKDEDDGWVKGIEYIKKQFLDVLAAHGVQEIETVGAKFDPQLHEAVGQEKGDAGVVLREVSGGYIVGDKVLRAAGVIVGE